MWDGEHPLDFGLGKEAITSAADEVKPESFSIALSGRGLDKPGGLVKSLSHVAFCFAGF